MSTLPVVRVASFSCLYSAVPSLHTDALEFGSADVGDIGRRPVLPG